MLFLLFYFDETLKPRLYGNDRYSPKCLTFLPVVLQDFVVRKQHVIFLFNLTKSQTKMKKLITALFTLSISLLASAQSLIPVPNSYLTPASATVCETTAGFGVRNLHAPTLPANTGWPTNFTLYLQVFVVGNISYPYNSSQIPYPWPGGFPNCYATNPGGNHNPIDIKNITFGGQGFNFPNGAQWNATFNMFEFPISLHVAPNFSDIENINYSVYLDCSLKSILGANLSVVVKWYYPGGLVTSPTLLTPVNPTVAVPVYSANIVPVLPIPNSQFITVSAPYNPTGTSDWYFAFQNNGTADANIAVGQFATDLCNSYSSVPSVPVKYAISPTAPTVVNSIIAPLGGLNWVTLPIGQPLPLIGVNDYLYIKKTVTINGCIDHCLHPPAATAPQVHFSWHCANAAIPPNCNECQQDYDIELHFNKGLESFEMKRITPTDAVAQQNTECQGDNETWQFEIKNTGNTTLDEINVTFNNPYYLSSFSIVSLPSVSSMIKPGTVCQNCLTQVTNPASFTPTFTSCTGSFPANPVYSFNIKIEDFVPGGIIQINFDIKNTPSSDEGVFLNSEKFYNQWRVQAVCTTKCGTLITPDYTNSIIGISNGISGYSTANNNIYGIDDINLITNYYPTTTDITVPNQDPLNPYFAYTAQFYSMGFSGLFGDDMKDIQALGAGTQIGGYIKAEIECHDGLSIANPYDVVMAMPYNGAWSQIKCIRYDHFTCGPYTQNVNINQPNPVDVKGVMVTDYEPKNCICDDKLFVNNTHYILYFKISDFALQGVPGASLKDLFTSGKFIFGFTSCCPYNSSPSHYTVKLSLLPNETCFNVPASGSDCNGPGTGAVCCWIPLSSEEGFINVHCPGCKSPGIIVDRYTVERTSLGFEDGNNNGQLPNGSTGTQIVHSPAQNAGQNTYSQYGNVELYKSVYGDELEDYLLAHFEPGDNTNGGYTYTTMMTSLNINLGYIQLYKRFGKTGAADYNVDVTGFDFYIDDPNITGVCDEYEFFEGYTNQNPTALHLTVDKATVSQAVWNSLFERGVAPDDDKMLFTFGETQLTNLTNQTGLSITVKPGWTINFLENQKYRLRVRYKVCGNKTPASDKKDDGVVENFMYLRGLPVNITYLNSNPSAITNEKMPNSRADLCALTTPYVPLQFPGTGYACNPPATQVTQTNLADAFFFYCEPFGSIHYFLSTSCRNTTTYIRNTAPPSTLWASTDCEAIVEIQCATSFLKSNYANTNFQYEFKAPPIIPKKFTELLPSSDWQWKNNGSGGIKAEWVSTYYNFYNVGYFQTNPGIPIQGIGITNPAIINIASAPTLNCFYESYSAANGFISDEASFQHLRLYMEPVNCSSFNPPTGITANHSQIEFGDNTVSCAPAISCSMTQPVATIQNELTPDPILNPPNPNLQFNIAPGVYSANSGTVTWHFILSNFAQSPSPLNPTEAKNVYIAFNSANLPGFLGAPFQVNYGDYLAGTVVVQLPPPYPLTTAINGNYFWLTPNGTTLNQLAPGHFFEGDITANVINCSALPSQVDFAWGWNCDNTPLPPPPPSANLCQLGTATVDLNSVPGTISTYTSAVPPNYTACDPTVHQATACFKNLSQVELLSLQTVTIPQSGYNVQFSGATSVTDLTGGTGIYSISGGSGTWNVNSTNPTLVMNDGFCITYNFATNGCNVGALQLPPVTVSGTDVCGNGYAITYTLPFVPTSGTSNCTDCYSIAKTAGSANAAPGDPVMFTITVCGNNGPNALPAILTDVLPQYFTPSPAVTFPQTITLQTGCTAVYMTGSYSDAGYCSDVNNINTATITCNGTSQSATACINVDCPDPATGNYHVTASDFLASSVFGGSPPPQSLIFVDDFVQLIIDVPILFNHCTFVMGSGSSIYVQNGLSLNLVNNTLLYSCPQMWAGIRVATNANINIRSSTLKDAESAVLLEDKANFDIRDSYFLDCVVGLETEATGAIGNTTGNVTGTQFGKVAYMLKAGYPGQQYMPGTVGRAGILLNDVALTIGDNALTPNEFFNINFGIEVYHSDVTVLNDRFHDIVADASYGQLGLMKPFGCAVTARGDDDPATIAVFPLASGATTIDNAPIGIHTYFYNARIQRIGMTNVVRGVNSEWSLARNVNVAACNIHATYRGIDFKENNNAFNMYASGNIIVVEPSGLAKGTACIFMTESQQGNNAHYNISDNYHLETRSGHIGIGTLGVENAWIGYNQVFTNQGVPAAPGSTGISLNGGGRNRVSCNAVTNTIPHTNAGTRGMDVNLSVNNRIDCNNFTGGTTQNPTGPYTGMRFGGTCGGTVMRGNAMRNNFEGLHLNNVGAIGAQTGTQTHNGNVWINYQSIDGAVNDNVGNEAASAFRVHTTMGFNMSATPQFYPHLNLTNQLNGWFVPQAGTPFSCSTSQTCMAAVAGGGGDDELEKMIAAGQIETAVYTDETKSMGKQYLFEKLAEDTTILATDTLYRQFYDASLNAPVGKLQEVKQDLNAAESYTPQQTATLLLADSLITSRMDSIALIDSLNALNSMNNYTALRENLINGINTLNAAIAAIMQQHETDADSLRNAASLKNSAVLPVELPETNNKLMNEMTLQFKANGIASISGNYVALLALAQQCPYAGGPAVYQARAMIEMVDETAEYFDDAVCLQSGIYRQAGSGKANKVMLPQITVIPNPADQQIEIKVSGKLAGLCHILIVNMLGEQTLAEQMACEEKDKKIDVSTLTPGVYTVKIYNSEVTKTTKLIISR
jgi:uncharacterized repeat protein (TIGR01451 family)